MSVTRATVRAAAKQLIQDTSAGLGTGVQLLLADPADYNTCLKQALRMFDGDIPNRRVVHYTMQATTFRWVLSGTGAILLPQPPALPAAAIVGTPGTAVLSYRVAARNANGQGLWSDAVQITNGPAPLSVTNKVTLTWAAVPGATSYDVFGRTPLGEGLLHNVSTTTYTDDGTDTPAAAVGTAGLDAWIYDGSELDTVWMPYFGGVTASAVQGQQPLDENDWRVVTEPGPVVILELQDIKSVIGQTLRLEFTSPHVVDENSPAYTSITSKWIEAFQTCVAAHLLRLVANRYLQNAGSTGLPNDVVDRRSQSDQAASRAKEFLQVYKDLIGGGDARGAASGYGDMDVATSHNRGFLWHPSRIR
jgi:hypothetical protein